MKIRKIIIFCSLLLIWSCAKTTKSSVSETMSFPEPKEWILVINPEGCKTCLDHLYHELSELNISKGAILIIAKNNKSMRLNPLFEKSPVPVYLDEKNKLIDKGFVDFQDQLLIVSNEGALHFDILEFESLLAKLKQLRDS
ncbi:hypothetical protein [Algoriphagus halophilus]|uniref:Uncharacterized protein n=1 Tax=Algoriphagus halophilus TaxID=226505 RepID=A0A1N6FZK8_9BACT|nr:hypothetical protein [Algoriphagus halophilus]SIO00693.1 hypothetical protein SAMN05444394_2853 [Algoriphagus halophilus]